MNTNIQGHARTTSWPTSDANPPLSPEIFTKTRAERAITHGANHIDADRGSW